MYVYYCTLRGNPLEFLPVFILYFISRSFKNVSPGEICWFSREIRRDSRHNSVAIALFVLFSNFALIQFSVLFCCVSFFLRFVAGPLASAFVYQLSGADVSFNVAKKKKNQKKKQRSKKK